MESKMNNLNAARHKRQKRRRRGGKKLQPKDNGSHKDVDKKIDDNAVGTAGSSQPTENKSNKKSENHQQPQPFELDTKKEPDAVTQPNNANSADFIKINKKFKKKKNKPKSLATDEQCTSVNAEKNYDENSCYSDNSGWCGSSINENQNLEIFSPDFQKPLSIICSTENINYANTGDDKTAKITNAEIMVQNSDCSINELMQTKTSLSESEIIVLFTHAFTTEPDAESFQLIQSDEQSLRAFFPLADNKGPTSLDPDMRFILQRFPYSSRDEFSVDDDDNFCDYPMTMTPSNTTRTSTSNFCLVENEVPADWCDQTNVIVNHLKHQSSSSTFKIPELFREYRLLSLINDAKTIALNLLHNMKRFSSDPQVMQSRPMSYINSLKEILRILQDLQMRFTTRQNKSSLSTGSSDVICVRRESPESIRNHSPNRNGKHLSRLEEYLLIKGAFGYQGHIRTEFNQNYAGPSTSCTNNSRSAIVEQNLVAQNKTTQKISIMQGTFTNSFGLFCAAYIPVVLYYGRLDSTYYIIIFFSLFLIVMLYYFGIV